MVNFIVFWKHFGNHISCNIIYIVFSSLEQIVYIHSQIHVLYFLIETAITWPTQILVHSEHVRKPNFMPSHDKSPPMTFRTKIWTLLVLLKEPKTVVKQEKWTSIMSLRHNPNQVEPSNFELWIWTRVFYNHVHSTKYDYSTYASSPWYWVWKRILKFTHWYKGHLSPITSS